MTILPNGVAVIDGDTHHAKWCAEKGLVHDRWFADEICKHLKKYSFVIEGGCNIGTLTAAMLEKGAIVLAIDPNTEAEGCIRKNCEKWASNLFFIRRGLSDRVGGDGLHKNTNAGASYLGPGPDVVFTTTETIDILSDGLQYVTLIKLDIEGYEVKALKGARDTIEKWHPVLILEVNRFALERAGDSDDALFALVEEMGYSWRVMQDNCRRGDPQFDIEATYK